MANIETRLQALHDEYASAVNSAVAEDRDELVAKLADEYTDVALALIAEDPAA
ncbi:MAG: hypothetical protein ACT4RN_02840 [Pseudonocardia sp.]